MEYNKEIMILKFKKVGKSGFLPFIIENKIFITLYYKSY